MSDIIGMYSNAVTQHKDRRVTKLLESRTVTGRKMIDHQDLSLVVDVASFDTASHDFVWLSNSLACRGDKQPSHDAARKVDQGRDARVEVSMAKVFATEMAWEIIDHAMQTFGAMGMAKEMPLQLMANKVRLMRIYDGPSEVHRWVIARRLLGLR